MYLEPWMIVALVSAFGICAYLNFRMGHREGLASGVTVGISGTFEYLEKHGIIKFLEDGTLKGFNRKIKVVDISGRV